MLYTCTCKETQVKCCIDGGSWIDCPFLRVPAPDVSRLAYFNKNRIYPTQHNKMNPVRSNSPSHQVFGLQIPEQFLSGVHTIEIKASDKWGFQASGIRTYYFENKDNTSK